MIRVPDTLAALAQSVEHLTRNEKVASSILAGGSVCLFHLCVVEVSNSNNSLPTMSARSVSFEFQVPA